ncbi:hypothetical protein A7K50_12440 [Dehalobacter sp. MCB1]|nr:hypothetical protein A7K50_12440 [Dehalobacter sp. MCB1]
MSGNLLDKVRSGPVTQSCDAVMTLLAFVGRASDPMPTDVTLDNGRMVLVLSNKKDAYYTCTARACSCPSATYRSGPCKHQRKHFPQAEATKPVSANASLKPVATWPGGRNGPVEDDLKVVA